MCDNRRYMMKKMDEVIMIPFRIKDNEKIILKGRGHQHQKKDFFGDLIAIVSMRSKSERDGKKIFISIPEAVLGVEDSKTEIGEKNYKINIPAGTQDGQLLGLGVCEG